jgi:hypothetical protein
MASIVCSSPVVFLRTFCLVGALALVACGDSTTPEPDGEKSDEDPSSEASKDASTKKPDAGKTPTAKDASTSDPNQIKPKDAGKPAVKEPDAGGTDASADAGSTTKPDGGGGTTKPTGDAGMSVSGIAAADLDMLRTVCVDEINMYRATLMLTPLARPDAAHEICSDEGAKVDGTAKVAHGWAKGGYMCTGSTRTFPGYFAQDTCPGWPAANVGAIASSLKQCLKQMWAEGEPPEGEEKCKADFQAGKTDCFLAHGHYLNMKGAFKKVSCSFFDMGKSTYWMNQDFQ